MVFSIFTRLLPSAAYGSKNNSINISFDPIVGIVFVCNRFPWNIDLEFKGLV